MSKELEALEGMFDLIKSQGSFEKAQKYYDILDEAISRLEAIDNSSPSEALKCVNWLDATIPQWCREKSKELPDTIKPIKQALKALEIIKSLCEVVETPVKKFRYLKVNGVVVYTFKNEEEFNLLKGILNDEQ